MEDHKDKNQDSQNKEQQHAHKSGNAANIDSIIGSPTEHVRAGRSSDSLGNTGANTSYEGATAPGGGGSAGTGYTSGQSGTGASISSDSDTAYVHGSEHSHNDDETVDNEKDPASANRQSPQENDTLGNP